jgi:ureidoacrylate peracid hydrolase
MTKESRFRSIYGKTEDGGVQLAASADRWHLHEGNRAPAEA